MKLWNGRWGAAAILTAAATAGLLAVPGTAGAAFTGTGAAASLTFQSATVAARCSLSWASDRRARGGGSRGDATACPA